MPEADMDARTQRTPGLVLTGLGGAGAVVGVVLLVVEQPLGLLVLMVALAACVLGLDMWVLRARRPAEGTQSRKSKRDAT